MRIFSKLTWTTLIILLLTSSLFAQNVGITDQPTGITPASTLQIHKDGTSGAPVIQVTNDATGEAASDGLKVGIDGSQNVYIINQEPGKSIIFGGTGVGSTTIESDGTLIFTDSATMWEDLRVSLQVRGGSSSPDYNPFGGTSLYAWEFLDNATDVMYFEVQLPHSWAEGTTIYPHVHWTGKTTDATNGVIWYLEYTWANMGTTYGATTTVSSTALAPGTALTHQMVNIPANGISGAGKTISSVLLCKLYRTGSLDPYTGNAYLLGFDIHYRINSVGSRNVGSK